MTILEDLLYQYGPRDSNDEKPVQTAGELRTIFNWAVKLWIGPATKPSVRSNSEDQSSTSFDVSSGLTPAIPASKPQHLLCCMPESGGFKVHYESLEDIATDRELFHALRIKLYGRLNTFFPAFSFREAKSIRIVRVRNATFWKLPT